MPYSTTRGLPPQHLSFTRKNKKWRQQCVDYGDSYSLMNYNVTMKTVAAMNINYDLLNGKIHMEDLRLLVNPYNIQASFIPDNIQHYAVMNSKLKVLKGEESHRVFDFKVIVTNPNEVSEIEKDKNEEVNARLQQLIADEAMSEEDFNQELEKIADYFTYEYQDKREIRGNRILNHYTQELELPTLFSKGFEDAYAVGVEAYLCDIVGGEPFVEKIDPRKMRVIRSGSSDKIEDADMIVLEDYWQLGRIKDTYADQLTKKDLESLSEMAGHYGQYSDTMGNIDARYSVAPEFLSDFTAGDSVHNPFDLFDTNGTSLPYDMDGNIRVLRVFWKSSRKIKKVKSYDPETGEEQFNFYPETYICDKDKGEEESTMWINEAWEGTKIGTDIYVNMRPRPIQYNRMSNPSKCHFGIIGSIYTSNGDTPFSMVDLMKPYSYLYDIISDRLNKTLAKNQGKLVKMDFAKVPKGWTVDQWLYYINVNGIVVENSWNEGEVGAATGRLAASLNNASSGVVDGSLGNEIQQYISLLEWLSNKIGELAGISKQREGQVSNRETVGGVERATLQSSHSTEWLFLTHDSIKKRVLECLLETTKIALKGRKKKFEFILSDGSRQISEIDGDEFAECDYGIIVDNSQGTQILNQKLDMLAQAALQNQTLDFSTIMQMYTTTSMSEKQRKVEANERRLREQAQATQQQQMQLQQMQLQQQASMEQAKLQQEYQMHQEKIEKDILVANINSRAEELRMSILNHDNAEANTLEREKISEEARQFDKKLSFEREKLKTDTSIKEKQIKSKTTNK